MERAGQTVRDSEKEVGESRTDSERDSEEGGESRTDSERDSEKEGGESRTDCERQREGGWREQDGQ